MQPVLSHVRGEELGFRKIPADVVATCSGAPQLMPHPDIPWLYDLDGEPVDVDLYDMATWRELKWSIYQGRTRARVIRRHGGGRKGRQFFATLEAYMAHHLERGKRFHHLLSQPSNDHEPVSVAVCSEDVPAPFGLPSAPYW